MQFDSGSGTTTRAATILHRTSRATAALAMGLSALCSTAHATETLEMDAAAGGPAGSGSTTADQVVALRRNTDNPVGNTFAATAAPVTVTYSLSNQRFTDPANQLVFGDTNFALAPYGAMSFESGPAAQFTSTGVGPATGVGIDTAANGRVVFLVREGGPRTQGLQPDGRHAIADLTLAFSRPVDNPVLHLIGLGGFVGAKQFTAEFDLLSAGSLTKLSGTADLNVAANQVNNDANPPTGSDCAGGATGCGSVRVNGTGLTAITLTVFLRGSGPGAWVAPPFPAGDAVGLGVSVDLPPQLTVRAQAYGSTGDFNYTGTNGFAGQNIQTNASGTLVAAPTQTLTVATPTVVSQSIVQGPPLTSASCTTVGTGTPVPATIDLAAGTVALDANAMGAGAQVLCTFTHGTPPTVAPIPTLGQWGVVLLGLLLAACSLPMLRRR